MAQLEAPRVAVARMVCAVKHELLSQAELGEDLEDDGHPLRWAGADDCFDRCAITHGT